MSREDLRKRYARVFRSLGRAELQSGALELSELDPSALLEPMTELWMGFYTEEGLHVGLERYGLFDEIRRLGYEEFSVKTGTEDADEHLLRIHSILPKISEPLIELVSRRSYLNLSGELGEQLALGVAAHDGDERDVFFFAQLGEHLAEVRGRRGVNDGRMPLIAHRGEERLHRHRVHKERGSLGCLGAFGEREHHARVDDAVGAVHAAADHGDRLPEQCLRRVR